jgi:hypothetical protein
LFGTFRWAPVIGIPRSTGRASRPAQLNQLRQPTSGQTTSTSYWAAIRCRDRAGAERLADRIPVSGTFARRVSKDGRLIERETRIKYLPGAPEVRPLLLEDGAHNSWQTPIMLWGSLAFAVFCAFGWVHMLRSSAVLTGGCRGGVACVIPAPHPSSLSERVSEREQRRAGICEAPTRLTRSRWCGARQRSG